MSLRSRVIQFASVLCILLLGVCLVGCGSKSAYPPLTVTLEQTEGVLSAAKFTGAEKKSPYEYFSAEIYLEKAKQGRELGHNKLADLYLQMAFEKANIAYGNARKYKRAK